jgi:hypothetical protein
MSKLGYKGLLSLLNGTFPSFYSLVLSRETLLSFPHPLFSLSLA